MPITYETPSPIGFFGNRSASGGGGGGGVPIAEMYAAEMQAKQRSAAEQAQLMQQDRFHQDAFREGQQQFAASRDSSPAQAFQAQQAQNQQAQRVQLQIQQNAAELSQAESLRLQRLKQGEDSVQKQLAEKSITPDEASAMVSQLRTGINPLEIRKAKAQITHQDMQNQALQAHMKLELQRSENLGKQEEARLAFANAQAEGKVRYIPNQAAAAQLKQQWADDFVGRDPKELDAAIHEHLMATGQYKTHYISKDGTLVEAKIQDHMPGAEGEGGTSRSSGSGSRSGRGAEKDFDPVHAMERAKQIVQKGLADGTITKEEAAAKQAEHFNDFKQAHADYHGEQEQQKTAGQPKPFNFRDPKSGSPMQQQRIAQLDEARRSLPPNVPPQVQVQVSKAVDEVMRLTAKYADETGVLKNPPKHVQQSIDRLNNLLAEVKGKDWQNPQGNQNFTPEQRAMLEAASKRAEGRGDGGSPPAPAAAPPGRPELGRGLRPDIEELYDRTGKYIGKQLPSKQQIRESAPPFIGKIGDYIRSY